ncbi:MAG: porin family protein [Rhizobiaceae bacterium]|nr:porin family protein [Rhizobiaceae bacterium]
MALKFLASAVALMCLCASGFAADMDAAEADAIPEYTPTVQAKGWYLRGDVSYLADKPVYDFPLFGREPENTRFGAGAGVGYRFNEWLRADLTANFVASDSLDQGAGSAKNTIWTGFATGYVDLGTFVGLTPYVGAGVGVMHSRDELRADLSFETPETQTEFAYSLNAGIGYQISDRTTFDVGYQFLASPNTEYIDPDTFGSRNGVKMHQIKFGLRYELP